MRRRLNIACGVLHRPKIVLLDEPTVGVDPQSRDRIYDVLGELTTQGVSLLLTTHHLEEAEARCSRTVIIDHGKIIAAGTLGELVEQTVGRYRLVTLRLEVPSTRQPRQRSRAAPQRANWTARTHACCEPACATSPSSCRRCSTASVRPAAPSMTSKSADRASSRCSSISPEGNYASNAHTPAHWLDQPEARSCRAGVDLPAADRVLFDFRIRLRWTEWGSDATHSRRRRGRRWQRFQHDASSTACARSLVCACGPRPPARPTHPFSIAHRQSGSSRAETSLWRSSSRVVWAQRLPNRGLRGDGPKVRVLADPSDPIAPQCRPGFDAESRDDGRAGSADGRRHEAVREVRRAR